MGHGCVGLVDDVTGAPGRAEEPCPAGTLPPPPPPRAGTPPWPSWPPVPPCPLSPPPRSPDRGGRPGGGLGPRCGPGIGLECHVELSTATKMFCGCRNTFGAPPNTNVCPVCLGHPGSLPVPNREAIRRIITIGLALGSEIAPLALPPEELLLSGHAEELPDQPVRPADLRRGHLDVELPDGDDEPRGHHARPHGGGHRQDDPRQPEGRIHDADAALVDFNRAGVPLIECVSEPDIRSPEEAGAYLRELRGSLESLDVSDVRMEEGSLRCDANISMRPVGTGCSARRSRSRT